MKTLILLIILSLNSFAVTIIKKDSETFELKKKSFKIVDIITEYAKLKELNLIMPKELKGSIDLYGVKEIKIDDLDLYISAVASEAGYTIIETKELNQIEVINERDIRYKSTKLFKNIDDVPRTYNHYKFVTSLSYAPANEISRNMRPFMSRYGRIIDEKNANSIIISDTGKNIHRIFEIIKNIDKKEYLSRKEVIQDFNKKHKITTIKKQSILNIIKDQHILFILAFSLMAGIIGFGISSHLNRKKMEW